MELIKIFVAAVLFLLGKIGMYCLSRWGDKHSLVENLSMLVPSALAIFAGLGILISVLLKV